jgi:hypothetical protein
MQENNQRFFPGLSTLGPISFVVAMSSCIVPVAPEFEPEPNSPPYIYKADPPVGTKLVQRDATKPPIFSVTLADQNLDDSIYVRWIVDYPPYDSENTRLIVRRTLAASVNGKPQRDETTTDSISCTLVSKNITAHRIALVYSDRKLFEEDDPRITNSDFRLSTGCDGCFVQTITWSFDMTCK